jgi:hypothetical protein
LSEKSHLANFKPTPGKLFVGGAVDVDNSEMLLLGCCIQSKRIKSSLGSEANLVVFKICKAPTLPDKILKKRSLKILYRKFIDDQATY